MELPQWLVFVLLQKDFPLILDEERELFNLADVDEDSFLSRDEYPAFALPHEYPRMHQLLINQTMRRKDKNKDGTRRSILKPTRYDGYEIAHCDFTMIWLICYLG